MRDCGGWVAIQRHPRQGRSPPFTGSRRLSVLGPNRKRPGFDTGQTRAQEREAGARGGIIPRFPRRG